MGRIVPLGPRREVAGAPAIRLGNDIDRHRRDVAEVAGVNCDACCKAPVRYVVHQHLVPSVETTPIVDIYLCQRCYLAEQWHEQVNAGKATVEEVTPQ